MLECRYMKRILLLSVFISLGLVTVVARQQPPPAVYAESGTWIQVAPSNAGFTILMPAKPIEKVDTVEGHPGVENHQMTLQTKLAGYVVTYLQFPDVITDPNAIKEMLDNGREGEIELSGGKLKSEKEIKLNEYFGREWVMELQGGFSATAGAYWVKRRLYQTVFIMGTDPSDPPGVTRLLKEAGTKFLDSFTLSGDVSK